MTCLYTLQEKREISFPALLMQTPFIHHPHLSMTDSILIPLPKEMNLVTDEHLKGQTEITQSHIPSGTVLPDSMMLLNKWEKDKDNLKKSTILTHLGLMMLGQNRNSHPVFQCGSDFS
jgi:hypothetical protein